MNYPRPRLRHIIGTIAVVLLLLCPAPAEQQGEILRDEFLGLELIIDPNWYNATAGESKDTILLASRETDDMAYLLISRLPGLGRTLESFDRSTQNFIFTRMKGFLDEEKHIEVNGHPAYLWIYQGESEVDKNGWRQFYRVISEKDGDFIVFQGVMNHEDFTKYRGTVENMIKSATWISSEP